MKKQKLVLPLLVFIFCSCQKESSNEERIISQPGQVDVYVAGCDTCVNDDTFDEPVGIPAYWKNGNRVPLDYSPTYFGGAATALSIAVSGNDVYVAGTEKVNGMRGWHYYGELWKNGNAVSADLANYFPGVAFELTALTVSNNDIYLVGPQSLLGIGETATYWKNNNQIIIPDASAGSQAISIAVSGNDVYVAGISVDGSYYNGTQNGIAKYWKNGQPVILTDGSNNAWATSIAVSATDVYVAGIEQNGQSYQDAAGNTVKKNVAKYWKNSQPVILTDGTEDAITKSIAVSGTDVYVAGTEWNGNSYQNDYGITLKKSVAKYWKNGIAVNLTDGTGDAVAKSIAIAGNDVYVAGTMNGRATYWKNGVAVTLSNVDSDANSIFLDMH